MTIKINPAGHTIRMLGSMYPAEPSATIGGTTTTTTITTASAAAAVSTGTATSAAAYLSNTLSASRMILTNKPTIMNSSSMSNFLLKSPPVTKNNRLASFIFNDKIPINLAVDWVWVKTNLVAILQLDPTYINSILNTIGPQDFKFTTVSVPSILQQLNITTNQLNKFLNTNLINVSTTNQYLSSRFNQTISATTYQTIRAIITSTGYITFYNQSYYFNQRNANVTATVEIKFAKVQYIPKTTSIRFYSVQLLITPNNNIGFLPASTQTFTFNTIDIPIKTAINYLPNDKRSYSFNLNVPYTLIHNTTSMHALAIFNGELRASYFQTCSPGTYTYKPPSTYSAYSSASNHMLFHTHTQSNFRTSNINSQSNEEKKKDMQTTDVARNTGSNMNNKMNIESLLSTLSTSSRTSAATTAATATTTNTVNYVAKTHPLPLTQQQTIENQVILSLLTSLFILIPLCYIPAAFVSFLVKERASKAKHIQLVSSVSPTCYWLSSYVWDSLLFTFLAGLLMCAFAIYGQSASLVYIGTASGAVALVIVLILYGVSVLPLCYLYSMNFDSPSTCQITITLINFFTGFIANLAYFIMYVTCMYINTNKLLHVLL